MDTETDNEESSDYEKAIELTGYKFFHWSLLVVCGIANANEAVAIICVSFLLPAAECEFELTTSQKGWLNVAMFVGMMIGGYIGGALCDLFGRRKILILSLLVDGIFTVVASVMQAYDHLIIMIMLVGVGVGSSVPVLWAYFTEFQPRRRRGTALCYLGSFWVVGNICVAILGWAVIPQSTVYSKPKKLHFEGWRTFVAWCAIPSFLVATVLCFFPKSPKYLMTEGKNDEAKRVLTRIYKWNNKKRTDVPNFALLPDSEMEKVGIEKNLAYVKHLMGRNASRLLHFPFRKVFCAIILVVFSLCFGYYGLWMWLPEMFKRMEHSMNDEVGLCDLGHPPPPTLDARAHHCAHPMVAEVFTDEIVVAALSSPGHVLTILFMDKIGRKIFLMSGMILSGLSVFAVWLVTSKWSCLLLSSLFGMLSALSHSALAVLGMEVFPTDLRGTAWGLSQISARLGAILGNIVFGELVDSRCSVPVLMVATFLVLGGLFSQVMPDLTYMPLL